MAKKENFPTMTPDQEVKKIGQEEREKGGYGMVQKDGITYPPVMKEKK
jgi:hypothetical protein